MRDIAHQLRSWHASGRPFAVASIVRVSGSAPREPGAALAVAVGGQAVGALSGGCVEGAVYELCRDVIATGRPVLERFEATGGDELAISLTCGGALEVFVQAVVPGAIPGFDAALTDIAAGAPVALARA